MHIFSELRDKMWYYTITFNKIEIDTFLKCITLAQKSQITAQSFFRPIDIMNLNEIMQKKEHSYAKLKEIVKTLSKFHYLQWMDLENILNFLQHTLDEVNPK